MTNKVLNKFKEFFATSWAIDNKTSVYVITVLITIIGYLSYQSIPREQFPEVIIPTILVSTVYPGTSPEDMENLVSRPIEKQIKSIAGVKKISSSSLQDFSLIKVEFNTDVDITVAKDKVKDAVDKSKNDLPNNLPKDPDIKQIELTEIPVMNVNLSGNYDLVKLKKYAELAKDKIEGLKEITRVDIVGGLEREIQINADMFKLQAASLTLTDIERAVSAENMIISAGNVKNNGVSRSIRVVGQFKSPEDIKKIVVKSSSGALVKIEDVASVVDSYKEKENYARLHGKNVITLNIVKKGGQNLIDASDKIKLIFEDLKENKFPKDINIVYTGDQSKFTRNTIEELNNTIIIGFLLVTIVLMFFMGFSNAFFVGLSVPISMFIAFMILPSMGYTMNMIVMFAFIFALGIVVDDAIVVIENTHRIHRTVPNIVQAAKMAAGEVFVPVLSGTLTVLAPFVPLAFWPGFIGKFMHFMPVTLILTLFASLIVAYIINPVFAVSFMKHEYEQNKKINYRKLVRTIIIMIGIALLCYVIKFTGMGNFMIFAVLVYLFYIFILKGFIEKFQKSFWPKIIKVYERGISYFLYSWKPYALLAGMLVLFFVVFLFTIIKKPEVLFFPENEPNNIYVYIQTPIGTDVEVTDSIAHVIEAKVINIVDKHKDLVESVITNVALGAGDPQSFSFNSESHKAKITINFIENKLRGGFKTSTILNEISKNITKIPGTIITVDKNAMGPPTGKPINIEISGDNLNDLIIDADRFRRAIDSLQIPGLQEMKSDFLNNKPEILINIDRDRANREGISTAQIGMEVRTAIFGKEISKYKEGEDEYPIQLRYSENARKNIDKILDLKITYRDMNSGMLRQIPMSTVAKVEYKNTYGGINRIGLKRVITLTSIVNKGYNANATIEIIKNKAKDFKKHKDIEIKFTGESDEQQDAINYLTKAMIIALGLIFFILITQFNSFSKSIIILSEVVFSIIGVLIGLLIFDMPIVIMMTGLGVVALGGIVVRNGILIVEFCDVLKARGMKTRQAIIEAGKVRLTPVVLTATATMLGLVPLAVGLNINFVTMFTELNPHLYFGGDNVMFWGPLSWTIIFGLSFATFLTLVFVPVMYYLAYILKLKMVKRHNRRQLN